MTKQVKILLIISALFTMALGLSNVFVNIFLWKKSNDFLTIAKYQLMHYTFTPISFIIAGWLSKKKNGIYALRIGVILFSAFFILILLAKDAITNYVFLFGALLGIASGFYWLAFQVLSFDFTCTTNRDTFNGYNGFMVSAAGAIAPLAAAYIIEKNQNLFGYYIVFFISLVLFIIQLLVSLMLRSETYGHRLIFKKIFGQNSVEWSNLRKAIGTWGLRDVVMIFIIQILIFQTTGSEMSLGKLSFLAFGISCVSYLLEQKFIKPKYRFISLHLGAIFLFIAVLGLVFRINYFTLLIYTIISSLFLPFFYVPMASFSFNTLSRHHEECYRIEYIINKEILLNTGRVFSILILIMLLTFFDNKFTLNYFLLFMACSQFVSLYFLRKIKTWSK